ncbi:MAG: Rossmann-like and DUF2520 domain-containing protein [Sphingobacteriaceae bacterium]
MKIALLGSGNVATHLGKALKNAGNTIVQVWSRNLAHAKELATNLDSSFTSSLSELTTEAEIYILSVSDDAIAEVASSFPYQDKLLVHTSGTTGIDIPGISGVFYPVQTFSKQKAVDFSVIPIAIEGKEEKISKLLTELANSVSRKVFSLTSEQRKVLHVAAVFACNFSNHLYAIADDILTRNNLTFDLIRPLIAETEEKVQSDLPSNVQTGPAVRQDQLTLAKHVEFLENNAELKEIYQTLSQSIINFYQKA